VFFIAHPGASCGCAYPSSHWLPGELSEAAHPPYPPRPALPRSPFCSVGGASGGCHRPPAAHPPSLPCLLRLPRQPPDLT